MTRWITQTRFYDPTGANPNKGNCLETAVACLLDIRLDQVPDFNGASGDGAVQNDNFEAFVESLGFHVMSFFRSEGKGVYQPECLYLASGPGPRGCHHVVVMRDGHLEHDPHPSGAGLLSVEHVRVLVPVDPGVATDNLTKLRLSV